MHSQTPGGVHPPCLAKMLETDTFIVDPVLTPGICHADNLTKESAETTEELLKDNNENYHIFFTMEDHMGVREATLLSAQAQQRLWPARAVHEESPSTTEASS